MELRPILSTIFRNKVGAALVVIQIAITLAVITNAVFMIKERRVVINSPSGLDEENSILVTSQIFDEAQNPKETIQADLRALKALSGVASASVVNGIPISNSGWGENIFTQVDDPDSGVTVGQYISDENGLEAYGLEMIEGRFFTQQEVTWRDPNTNEYAPVVVVSQAAAEKLFPNESAVGKVVYDELQSPPTTIIGVYDQMQMPWVGVEADLRESTAVIPGIRNIFFSRYLVRAKPGERDRLIPIIEDLLTQNRGRVITSVRTTEWIKARSYSSDKAMVVMLTAVITLLTTITALGIVGLAWFSITRRKKLIGTRRALGAQKHDILRYFMLENWLLTSIGLVVGIVLSISLNFLLDNAFQIGKMDWYYIPISMVFLWLLGLAAVFVPALRASSVPPALATRNI